MFFFFFFQAEDGIRDYKVTGVQTCALPISGSRRARGPRPPPIPPPARAAPRACRGWPWPARAAAESSAPREVDARRAQRRALKRRQLSQARARRGQQALELTLRERLPLGRALDLDVAAGAGHDQVEVDLGGAVVGVGEVEQPAAADDPCAPRGGAAGERQPGQRTRGPQPLERKHEGHVAAGDRRGAGPAVGLEHVAVDQDRALAERGHIHDRAETPPDQALDLVRAPARAAALALDALARAARQHGVLRRDPAPALAAQEGRHALLHGRRAHDPRRAHLDQRRPLGGREEAGRELDRPELPRAAAIGTAAAVPALNHWAHSTDIAGDDVPARRTAHSTRRHGPPCFLVETRGSACYFFNTLPIRTS